MDKYNKYSKEDLVKLLQKQEEELKNKKYGLVWDAEREPEQVVLDCENNLPVLKRVKGKEIRTDLKQEDNILIEGDNYHALTVLNYTHKEKIDVIYIDPPYNTGNKDFIYNDRYVDKEDGFRHSKWLNFMEKRLNLARDLLKESGVIFISIDDNEVAQLKLLCDKVFGEQSFVTNIVWQSKTGASDAKTIDTTTEYILVYVKSAGETKFARNKFSYEVKRYRFKDKHEKIRGPYYPDNLDRGGLRYSDSLNYAIKCPDGKGIFPNGRTEFKKDGWTWKWGKKKVEWGIKNDYIEFKKNKNKKSGWSVYYKNYMFADNKGNKIERSAPQKNIILDIKTGDGATTIKQLFNYHIFKYSKPAILIQRIIDYIDVDKSGIILDFMAGSGTTGQAVLGLNKEDQGTRKFILCTNNEGNICTDVCYPRLKKVIKGYKKNGNGEKVDGLGGNLQYFKTALVKKSQDELQTRIDLTGKCAEMLCVKENIFNLKNKNQDYQIYSANGKNVCLGIYFNYIEDSFAEFYQELKKIKEKKIVYIFSLNNEVDKKIFKGFVDIEIKPIPENILEVYRKLILFNIPLRLDVIRYDLNRAKDDIFNKKDKDSGTQKLRVVLEKTIQKIAQNNNLEIYKAKNKAEKITTLNDRLKREKIITKVEWEENKTYLAIGNHAAHGEYNEYKISQVKNFYKHVNNIIQKNNINI